MKELNLHPRSFIVFPLSVGGYGDIWKNKICVPIMFLPSLMSHPYTLKFKIGIRPKLISLDLRIGGKKNWPKSKTSFDFVLHWNQQLFLKTLGTRVDNFLKTYKPCNISSHPHIKDIFHLKWPPQGAFTFKYTLIIFYEVGF